MGEDLYMYLGCVCGCVCVWGGTSRPNAIVELLGETSDLSENLIFKTLLLQLRSISNETFYSGSL